jgi:hypothetical protein
VDDAQALAEIQRLAGLGRIRYTLHATQRMSKRGATADDVQNALVSASRATHQPANDNWRVSGGVDLDGDDLTVVVDIQADVVVVTLF